MLVICTMRNQCLGKGGVIEFVSHLRLHWLIVIHKELIPRLREWGMMWWQRIRIWQTLVYLRHIGTWWVLSCEVSFVIFLILVFRAWHKIWLCSILLQAILGFLYFQVLREIKQIIFPIKVWREVVMVKLLVMVWVHEQLGWWLLLKVHHT